MPTGKTRHGTGTIQCRVLGGLGRFLCVLLLAFFVLPLGIVPSQPVASSYAAQQITGEYELKAVYLYNFLHFVQWPREKPVDSNRTFIIGVVGESPLDAALADLRRSLRGTKRRGIKVVFHGPYQPGMDLTCCDLIFINGSEYKKFPEILAGLGSKPVLTVAEHKKFLASGGMINLVKHKGKARWEINRTALKQAGLQLSAKLMDIAVKVIE